MTEDAWVSRKRKLPLDNSLNSVTSIAAQVHSQTVVLQSSPTTSVVVSQMSMSAKASSTSMISELGPFLEWTKLTPCHRKTPKRHPLNLKNPNEGRQRLQKVTGKAIFFIHNPNTDINGSNDDPDSQNNHDIVSWFQGRFFPSSFGLTSPHSTVSTSTVRNSWGLLCVQKAVVDECLRCSQGGYRELDLTCIRYGTSKSSTKKKAVRWTVENLIWTGGDMVRLSTNSFSASLNGTEEGVKFESTTMLDGGKARDVARTYFPDLMKRLTVADAAIDLFEIMIIIGDMELVVPTSFISRGNDLVDARNSSDSDDGLWSD